LVLFFIKDNYDSTTFDENTPFFTNITGFNYDINYGNHNPTYMGTTTKPIRETITEPLNNERGE